MGRSFSAFVDNVKGQTALPPVERQNILKGKVDSRTNAAHSSLSMSHLLQDSFNKGYVDFSRLPSGLASSSTTTSQTNSYDVIAKLLVADQPSQVKEILRAENWPVDHPIRKELWVGLCRYIGKDKHVPGYYETTVKDLLGDRPMAPGLPVFCDPIYISQYYLNVKGQQAVVRVLCVVAYSHPSITYCPVLYPLAAILMHYLSEEECYACLCDILSASRDEFVAQTKGAHEARALVAMKMSRKFAKQGFFMLQEAKMKHGDNHNLTPNEAMTKAFDRWLCWLFLGLPFQHLVRVIDCFLLEGSKVLIRTIIALLICFAKYNNGLVASRAGSSGETKQYLGLSEEVVYFCQNNLIPVDKFLKLGFGIRALSRKEVRKRLVQADMLIKSHSFNQHRRVSDMGAMGIPTTDSLYEIHMTASGSLSVKEMKPRMGDHLRHHSVGMIPLRDFHTGILTADQIGILMSWIPTRITMLQPHLVYSTNEHGSSQTAFFMRVDEWEPNIIIIKASNDQVFGAYCSQSWAERNTVDELGNHRRYFGTGETFLFKMTPKPKKFPWVGVDAKTSVQHSQELFMAADKHWICVGSGNGNGLWLDESFSFGKTEHCDTFNNEPLCSDGDFNCKVVEVIGFQ